MAVIKPTFTQVATGLRFPEGPVAMPMARSSSWRSSAARSPASRRTARSTWSPSSGEVPTAPPWGRVGGSTSRTTAASSSWSGRASSFPSGKPTTMPRAASRSSIRERKGRHALRRVRRAEALRPERPRLRSRGRLLVHRPRQDARARRGPGRRLLREGRRLHDPRSDLPPRAAERHRALPDEKTLYVSRRPPRAAGPSASPGRARSSPPTDPTAARRASSWPASGAIRCSTRSPWTVTATSAWQTLITGAVSDIWPDGSRVDQYTLPDMMVTNVCFGGRDLRTAYATLSMGGTLVSFEWPRPGLALNHLNRAAG